MNTYIKSLFGCLLFCFVCSCSNDLEETVYSSITEQNYNYTKEDFAPSVASVYSYLRNFPSHGGFFCTQEVSADAIVMPPNASGWDDGGIYVVYIIIHGIQSKVMCLAFGLLSIAGHYFVIK